METQQQMQELKAERVQEEVAALVPIPVGEPFRISLKAERVQEPAALLPSLGGPVSLAYEMSFNQMRTVSIELEEPQIVISLFATGGQEAA